MKENTPKVSVIVPVYKAEKYITRCVQSLLHQTLDDLELIFVDDASPDNSIQIIKKEVRDYNVEVKILRHNKNRGSSQARATGLSAAQGEWIGWCDADDFVNSTIYEKMYQMGIKENADIVACNYFINSENKQETISYPYDEEHKEMVFNPYRFGNIYGALWNKLIRKSLYDTYNISTISGINIWEDSTLTIRLRWYSRKTIILQEPLYHYWVGERQSVFFSTNDISKVDEMICAVNFFMNFFESENVLNEAQPLLQRLKLLCKERLMSVSSYEGLKKWKSIFPENDKQAWLCKDYTFRTKLKIFLLHHLPLPLAFLIFKIRR